MKSILPPPPKKKSSDNETIACMEAALKKVKADKVTKGERQAAEEHWITEAKAAEEHRVAEARAAEERRIAEAKAQEEEERNRAQAEALRQQKLLAALEAKWKADKVADRKSVV